MIQPTEAPSRASIVIMGLFTVLVIGASFWVLAAPEEEFTRRHVVGYVLGLTLGVTMILQTFERARRRMVVLEAARREQAKAERDTQLQQLRIERDDEVDSDI